MSGSAKEQTTGTSSSQTSPWAPQATDLSNLMTQANPALAQSQTAKAPTDFTAQFTPDQLSTFQQMLGYAGNSTVPQTAANAGAAITGSGSDAVTGALTKLGAFNPTDPTASNIADANQYVAGANIPGQVQNAMLAANQNARDVTLPGIDSAAGITGNTNSSRTGIGQGIVSRGLDEQAADLSSALTGQTYNAGLDRAQSGNQFNTNAILQALQTAGTVGNTAVGTGVGAGSSSIADQGTLFNMANTAGAGEQASNQADLTNQAQKFNSDVTSPFAALQAYLATIGSQNYGSSTTGTSDSTKTTTPSAWQVAGGLLGAGGSLLGSSPGTNGGGSGVLGLLAKK